MESNSFGAAGAVAVLSGIKNYCDSAMKELHVEVSVLSTFTVLIHLFKSIFINIHF